MERLGGSSVHCPGCRHRCRRDAGQLELAVPVLRQGSSFVNLNDYSDVLDLTQFPSSALDACTVANSLQAVPVAMAGRIYYWNMATFKKAGLDHYPTTEQLLDTAKTFQEKLGDDYYPLAAGPLDRMIMMTFYLESKYGEPWVTDSTLNYTVETSCRKVWNGSRAWKITT